VNGVGSCKTSRDDVVYVSGQLLEACLIAHEAMYVDEEKSTSSLVDIATEVA